MGQEAGRDGDALRGERPVHVDELGARADHGLAPGGPDRGELGHVEDQAAVAGRPARVRVAAVADRDGDVVGPRVGERGADVVGVGDVGDGGRLQAVEAGVVELARGRPLGLAGGDEGAVEVLGECLEVRRGGGARAGGADGRAARRAGRGPPPAPAAPVLHAVAAPAATVAAPTAMNVRRSMDASRCFPGYETSPGSGGFHAGRSGQGWAVCSSASVLAFERALREGPRQPHVQRARQKRPCSAVVVRWVPGSSDCSCATAQRYA